MPLSHSFVQGATPETSNADLTPAANTNLSTRPLRTAAESSADVEQYRDAVEKLMLNQSALGISNSMPAHAAVLFEKFFQHAKRNVRIFCWKLNSEVFADEALVRQAEAALLRGVKITVITQAEPEASPFLDLMSQYPGSASLLSTQNATGSFSEEASNWEINFAVMDERALRVEKQRGKMQAQAAMNLPDYAKKLNEFFNRMLDAIKSPQPTGAG